MKAIIFDVDGVIFKTHDTDGTYLWSRSVKEDLGLTKGHFEKIFSSVWIDVTKGKIDTIAHLESVFKDPVFKELDINSDIYINYWLGNDNHINNDVLTFVKDLDIPCYLGTNQEKIRTEHIMASVGTYFDGCFPSYKIGSIKPEKDFFQYIEGDLRMNPEDLLLVDDTAENIAGARACGWQTYHYQNDLENLKEFIGNAL